MTPERRAQLDNLLAQARQSMVARHAAIAALSDEALIKVTGIPDVALARKVAATDRIALRLVLPPETARGAPVSTFDEGWLADNAPDAHPSAESTDPMESNCAEPAEEAAEADSLLKALACAIGFSALPDWPNADELTEARQQHGDAAVAFALAHRGDVPAWMRLAAGLRAAVHRQFAATALLCVDELPVGWQHAAMAEDPLPVTDDAARHHAGVFVARALRFLQLAKAAHGQHKGED